MASHPQQVPWRAAGAKKETGGWCLSSTNSFKGIVPRHENIFSLIQNHPKKHHERPPADQVNSAVLNCMIRQGSYSQERVKSITEIVPVFSCRVCPPCSSA